MRISNDKIFSQLSEKLDGELLFDNLSKQLYATDASVYRMLPKAVAFPKNSADIQKIIRFASLHKIGLTPRAAGTSLAGQCVNDGMIVDVSKHFNTILEIDEKNKTVVVEPGVIRDDLNRVLKPYGLFFAPNTSTSNRCMIGGMVGNNSSGTTSIKYGVTRDKVVEMEVVLPNGEIAAFGNETPEEFFVKANNKTTEGKLYSKIYDLLMNEEIQSNIHKQFPKPEIHRRNTGYAIDELIKSEVFKETGNSFNLCKLFCGSEGTLAFTTKIKLQLDSLPPTETIVVAAHFKSVEKCLQAVKPVMQHDLYACEMMDKLILDCTKKNLLYNSYRFFIDGDPEAILLMELRAHTKSDLILKSNKLCNELEKTGLAYAWPLLKDDDIDKALELRKAGLGLLGNMIGDKKAVACIEDTAVAIDDLSSYITEFTALMKAYNQKAVYYAHAGAGELHLRPILNLKKTEDVVLFEKITTSIAQLVKKYKGSMSGEHGDGIVRSSFIEFMIGSGNYEVLKSIKTLFDPEGIMNPGKIINAYSITENLRYFPNRKEPEIDTLLDFSDSQGILRATEKCNGSGDCRKPEASGGVMCPSFRVTQNEQDSTRGRANVLREVLTNSSKINKFNHEEIQNALELCISCKGCKNECPSNVDMATYKAEFEYQFQKQNKPSLRTKLFAHFDYYQNKVLKIMPLANYILSNSLTSYIIKKGVGIAPKRSLPLISSIHLYEEFQILKKQYPDNSKIIYFFADEFTVTNDGSLGLDALQLLFKLGYDVKWIHHKPSGRALISKGFLEEAKQYANENITIFKNIITKEHPLIGIEPSAILTFRDEYLRLADDKNSAQLLADSSFTIDEFLASEIKKGVITKELFTSETKTIKLHLHCHQKALSSVKFTFDLLNLPQNFKITIIHSGCCGMAGSFGYEKEHYDLSMKMGELSLFPAVRKADVNTIFAATGTSCRHQIKDGTGKQAFHPVSILNDALL
ncbi:FAD-linked oxidase C-terminal domain-containing protein [uncultured Planktosalinus sp.]|uniref:FAD-binding and (Fe-S)-binding domain-containing protein n=1 Tax=uncultured Planktosalinus sp. TaxID=1810935 RepID=UPI0030D7F22C